MTGAHGTHRAAQLTREIRAADAAVYQAVASAPTPTVDRSLRRLSEAADHSMLWLAIAALLAAKPGHTRRAAVTGAAAIGLASATVNLVAKRVVVRRRPDPVVAAVPTGRRTRIPGSTSFPSGHAASAVAFATAVGDEVPWLSLPLHLLAATVAYSRVHTGVHYPLDVVVGATVGAASGSAAKTITRRLLPWL